MRVEVIDDQGGRGFLGTLFLVVLCWLGLTVGLLAFRAATADV